MTDRNDEQKNKNQDAGSFDDCTFEDLTLEEDDNQESPAEPAAPVASEDILSAEEPVVEVLDEEPSMAPEADHVDVTQVEIPETPQQQEEPEKTEEASDQTLPAPYEDPASQELKVIDSSELVDPDADDGHNKK